MGSSKRRKPRIVAEGSIGAQAWPPGSGDPIEDLQTACLRSFEKWEGLDIISPELRRKLGG
jgi:hypothetical protein